MNLNNTNNLDWGDIKRDVIQPTSYSLNGMRITREEYERRGGVAWYYTATFTWDAPAPAPITTDEILDAHDQLRGDVRLPEGW